MSVQFTTKTLNGTLAIAAPTALQWGPDGRLYILARNGQVDVVTVQKDAGGTYAIAGQTVIGLVAGIPNHDDDGRYNAGVVGRQTTGLVVTGTADRPVVYVSSSDPRAGGGSGGGDVGLDTNSGTISRLEQVDGVWQKVDIVRGLPRSEADHATNGLALADDGRTLLVAQGGMTNAGAPSTYFAGGNDYALSGAILRIDLDGIAAAEAAGLNTYAPAPGVTQTYIHDLPTLNDPTRPDGADGGDLPGSGTIGGDPFGGNDGLNMAMLVADGPVRVQMAGFRNPYDVLVTEDGRAWSYDNGPAASQGGAPIDQDGALYTGADGQVTSNQPNNATFGVVNNTDQLHQVVEGGYAGSPNLIRALGAAAGLLRSPGAGLSGATLLTGAGLPSDFADVVASLDPREALYREGGVADGALDTTTGSTNGLAEYTASTLIADGAGGRRSIKGAILATNFQNNQLVIIDRYADGDGDVEFGAASGKAVAENRQVIALSGRPLGIDAVGDRGAFPGTIWVTTLSGNRILILEPGAGSNYAPVITSAGGGASATLSVAENGTAVATIAAADANGEAIGFSIAGGADAALFAIGAQSGVLTLRTAQDLERPGDADRNGLYDVIVRASDGALSTTQALGVRLTNIVETQTRTLTNNADAFVAPSDDHWIVNAASGNDRVTTAGGDDRITGGRGNDILASGAGDDLFGFAGASGSDTIDGGAGVDTIQAVAADAVLDWGAYTGVEAISGGGFANVRILGSGSADRIDLTGLIVSGIAAIDGGKGDDVVIGSAGDDVVIGNAGNDMLAGGDGSDSFLFAGSSGIDTIDGGMGTDTVRATAANAVLNWGRYTGVEAIAGGGFANVRIVGSGAADTIDLSAIALAGIHGIAGGGGGDTITGSAAADRFIYTASADSRVASGVDTIIGFEDGVDLLDLAALDANARRTGVQDFAFIGTAAFSRIAGELRVDRSDPGRTVVQGDIDGNGAADFSVILLGAYALSAADFVF